MHNFQTKLETYSPSLLRKMSGILNFCLTEGPDEFSIKTMKLFALLLPLCSRVHIFEYAISFTMQAQIMIICENK